MRGTVSKYAITLKKKQRKKLEKIVWRRSPSHWLVQRARIVLRAAQLRSVKSVCAALSVDRQVVRRWCKRFVEGEIQALKDRPRRGRPLEIKPPVWQKVATLVVQPPTNVGVELARWTVRELSTFLAERQGWEVSRSSISRFLRKMALKPHRIRYWLNPTDAHNDVHRFEQHLCGSKNPAHRPISFRRLVLGGSSSHTRPRSQRDTSASPVTSFAKSAYHPAAPSPSPFRGRHDPSEVA